MSRRFLLPFAGAASVALSWLSVPLARAQPNDGRGTVSANAPAGEKVRLEYRGLSECPDAATFRAAVARRLAGDWEASPGELARRIDVVVSRVGDGYVATIQLLDAQGRRLRRAVRGRDCGDVVNGIALVTALAVEARLDEAVDSSEPVTAAGSAPDSPGDSPPNSAQNPIPPAPSPPVASSPVASPPVASPPVASPPVASSPVASPPAPVGPTPASAPVEVAPVATSEVPLLGWRAGLRAGVLTGIGPQLAPGLSLAGTLELGAARFGLSLFGFSSGRVTEAGVEARFDLLAARIEGCPIAFDVAGPLSLEPCVSFEAGALSGRGYSDPPTVDEGQSGRSPWLAPGAVARLVGSFGQLVVELEGSARFPLSREEFYVDSESEGGESTRTSVHQVPVTSFGVAVGVGLHF